MIRAWSPEAPNSADSMVNYVENQSGTSGVLSVSDGVHQAQVNLVGQYTAESFQAADDHHGGTLVALHLV